MDRDAIARGHRREEALEALQFERDREAALSWQLAEIVLEEARPRIDEQAYAAMDPAAAEVVRETLRLVAAQADDDLDEWAGDFPLAAEGGAELDEEEEDEAERLLGEISTSRARQAALESFVKALEGLGT